MKIKVWASTHYVNSSDFTIIEVEDDATDDEIETAVIEAMFELIDWGWVIET